MIYTVEIILTKGRRKHFLNFYQVSDFSRFTTGITILFVENVEMNCIYYPLFPASFFQQPNTIYGLADHSYHSNCFQSIFIVLFYSIVLFNHELFLMYILPNKFHSLTSMNLKKNELAILP